MKKTHGRKTNDFQRKTELRTVCGKSQLTDLYMVQKEYCANIKKKLIVSYKICYGVFVDFDQIRLIDKRPAVQISDSDWDSPAVDSLRRSVLHGTHVLFVDDSGRVGPIRGASFTEPAILEFSVELVRRLSGNFVANSWTIVL